MNAADRDTLLTAASLLNQRGNPDVADKLRALASRQPEGTVRVDDWQDIATAPKDGTRLLVLIRGMFSNDFVTTAKWCDDRYAKKPRPLWQCPEPWIAKNAIRECPPTHWQPLPIPQPQTVEGQVTT